MFQNGFWKRLACISAGAVMVIAGTLINEPALTHAGVGLIGWATPFPAPSSSKAKPDAAQDETPDTHL